MLNLQHVSRTGPSGNAVLPSDRSKKVTTYFGHMLIVFFLKEKYAIKVTVEYKLSNAFHYLFLIKRENKLTPRLLTPLYPLPRKLEYCSKGMGIGE